MPSRWAVAAAGATLDLNKMQPWTRGRTRQHGPAVGAHRRPPWGIDMAALIALGVICGFVVARLLRRHEPEVMRK